MKKRNQFVIWMDALEREFLWHFMSDRVPYYLVTEYPKSGASWFCQMLSDYIGVPFYRNEMPPLREGVLHGHHLYNSNFNNLFCVLRDGRDVAVSSYYHLLFKNEKNKLSKVKFHRSRVPFEDYKNIRSNLPRFIEYIFVDKTQKFKSFNWAEFVNSYKDEDVCMVKYEDMLVNAAKEVGQAAKTVLGKRKNMERLTKIEKKYSFEKQSGRQRGEEAKSFLRKGIAGDWKNHFTYEACRVFDEYAGDILIDVGYEDSDSWVEKQKNRIND